MNKKVSLSFGFAAVLTLFSLTGILNVFKQIVGLLRLFTPLGFVNGICSIAATLTPVVLLVLLILNVKRDVKRITPVILIVLGIVQLWMSVRFVMNGGFPSLGEGVRMILGIADKAVSLLVGTVMILAACGIKQKRHIALVPVLTGMVLILNLLPAVALTIAGQQSDLIAAVCPSLLVLALAFFPKTIYDYEQCTALNKQSVTIIIVAMGILLFCAFVAGGITNGASDSGNDYPYGMEECFRCGGSGLVNEGFLDFETCPVCGGGGMLDSH